MAGLPIPGEGAADREAALTQYRRRAAVYDLELAAFEPVRRRAVARLGLAAGDTVLDLGCGTGLSFALLHEAIGPAGVVSASSSANRCWPSRATASPSTAGPT